MVKMLKSFWNIQNKILALFFMNVTILSLIVFLSKSELAGSNIAGALASFFLVASFAASCWVVHSIVRPLQKLTKNLDDLGKGISPDIEAFVPNTEMGDVFEAMVCVKGNLDAINRTQAVIQFKTDGTILNANENFLGAVGYELHEIVGKHHSMFGEEEFVKSQDYKDFWAKLGRGEFDTGEYYRVGKGGKPIWIFASYVPVFDHDGNPVRVVKFASDITKEVMERQAEAERRKEAELIALASSETDNLVIITDADQNIEYVNDGFTRLTGYTAEEVMGKNPKFLQGKDTCQKTVKRISEQVKAKQPFYDEILNYKKDGTAYWVSLSINPVMDDNGNITRFVSVQGDVTANKLAKLEDEKGQQEAISVLNALADGDLSQKMNGSYTGTFAQIKSSINTTIDKLSSIASDIKQTSGEVSAKSNEVSDASDQLSHRTESQAATLEEINATMIEITSTVRNNKNLAEKSSQSATEARAIAHDGQEVLQNLVGSMEGISESSQKITDIIGLIDTLASQTNLLALNAAVEAARAGDAGRGFAVVASEVRTLASRSADASDEIKKLILESSKRVTSGSQLAEKAGGALEQIVASIDNLAGQVDEISKASKDQAHSIDEIGSALGSMDQVTQQNSAMATKSTNIAQELRRFSNDMTALIDFFRLNGGAAVASQFSFASSSDNMSFEEWESFDEGDKSEKSATSSGDDEWGDFGGGDDWFSGAA